MSPALKRAIVRLIIISLLLVLAAVLFIGMTNQQADQGKASGPSLVPEAEISAKVTAQGKSVKSLVLRGTLYEVTLEDGSLLTFDATSGEELSTPKQTGPAMATLHVIKKLEKEGYSELSTPVWKKGKFHSLGLSPKGVAVKLEIDPFSGDITKETPQ
ncbi:hypothetical protein ACTL6U_09435 [Rhodovibrionaceae bacterium A322]